MKISQIEYTTKGVFIAQDNSIEAGKMTYSKAGDHSIIINHTFVKSEYRNKNIGKILIIASVNYAREKQLKIIPFCKYAKIIFKQNPEIQDVLL